MKYQRKASSICFGLSFFAASVHADSSVTLYGVADTGIVYTSNQAGHSNYQLASGNVQGSRWGLTGAEDLGQGMKAIFRLENGFNLDNGSASQGGREFGRQAYAGIATTYGTVTLGRQYNSVQDLLSYDQATGMTPLTQFANAPFDTDNINNTYRTNNSVKYVSPAIGGLSANAMYGFSNTADAFADNRLWSVGLSYRQGPLRVDAAYALANKPGSSSTGAIANDNYYSAAIFGLNAVSRNQVFGAGATYVLGNVSVAALYTNVQFDRSTGGSFHFSNYEGAVNYRVTPAWNLAVGYIYTTLATTSSSTSNAHYQQISAGANYFLSKRTDLYLNGVIQHASNAKAWIEAISSPSSSGNQVAVIAGIRHKF